MKRKTYIKKLMGLGLSRDNARLDAQWVQSVNEISFETNHAWRENGDYTNRMDFLPYATSFEQMNKCYFDRSTK